jgi:membrane fusion protein (multidrug efflux system)
VAEAEVAAVEQRVSAQEAAVKQALAAVVAADSGVHQAESAVAQRLAGLDRAQAAETSAKSGPQQVSESRSQTDVAQAEADRAKAEVEQAKLNLSYTKICAPVAGHVTRKSIEPGSYVQVGQALLALVEPNVWVVANFKETQLTNIRVGQPVSVVVDVYPGVKFAAHVESIQRGSGAHFSMLPPENATGNYVKVVQRVPVKIVFDDPKQVAEHLLGPGMSVVPTIDIRTPSKPGDSTRQE